MRVWPCLALLAATGACSTFTEDPGASDAAADAGPSAEAGPSDDAGADRDSALDDADAGIDGGACALFGAAGQVLPPGWVLDAQGASFSSMLSPDGRRYVEALVSATGQRAAAARDLEIPANGRLTVTVDVQVAADKGTNQGWIVDVVTVSCATPKIQVSLEVSPGPNVTLEAGPVPPSSMNVAMGTAPGFTTLRLGFAGSEKVFYEYRGASGVVALPDSILNAKGCVLRVGAVATGTVPVVAADIAEVCVTSP